MMWISDYFLSHGYWYRRPVRKVIPVEKPGDPAYDSPEKKSNHPKGKRDFSEKGEKTQKIPEKNLLSLWV